MGYVSSTVVFESEMLLAFPWVGLSLRLADCEDLPRPQCINCCLWADPMNQNSPQQVLVPADIPLWLCHLWDTLVIL